MKIIAKEDGNMVQEGVQTDKKEMKFKKML